MKTLLKLLSWDKEGTSSVVLEAHNESEIWDYLNEKINPDSDEPKNPGLYTIEKFYNNVPEKKAV